MKDHKDNCPAKYRNLQEAGIECTCEPTEQPPAGEDTNKIRQWVEDHHYLDTRHSLPDFVCLAKKILKLCNRLDIETQRAVKAEAENRRLKNE